MSLQKNEYCGGSNIDKFNTAVALYNCSGRRLWIECERNLQKGSLHLLTYLQENKLSMGYRLHLFTGSRWAGMPVEVCEDKDGMFCLENWPVVVPRSPDDAKKMSNNYVIAHPLLTNSAYLQLEIPDNVKLLSPAFGRYVVDPNNAITEFNGKQYLNSKTFLELNMRSGDEKHGPSVERPIEPSNADIGTEDNVPCLVSSFWPESTNAMFDRLQNSPWYTEEVIKKIKNTGCHVVALGQLSSQPAQNELEWAWAFSLADKELTQVLSDHMAAAFYTMKALKKHLWYKDPTDKSKTFTSYTIKTACFWVFETLPTDSNHSVGVICHKVCEWLIDAYKEKYIPHYFITGNNLIGHLESASLKPAKATLWLEQILSNLDEKIMSSITEHAIKLVIGNDLSADKIAIITPNIAVASDVFKKRERFNFVRTVHELYPSHNSGANTILVDKIRSSQFVRQDIPEYDCGNLRDSYVKENLDYLPSMELDFSDMLGDTFINDIEAIFINNLSPLFMLGELYHLLYVKLSYKQNRFAKLLKRCSDGAIQNYSKEPNIEYPDGWNDQGLARLTLLAKHYWHSKQQVNLKETLEKLDPIIQGLMEAPENLQDIIYLPENREDELSTRYRDKRETPMYDTSTALHHPVYMYFYYREQYEKDSGNQDAEAQARDKQSILYEMLPKPRLFVFE